MPKWLIAVLFVVGVVVAVAVATIAISLLPDDNLQAWEVLGWLLVFATGISLPLAAFFLGRMFRRGNANDETTVALAATLEKGERPFTRFRLKDVDITQVGGRSAGLTLGHHLGEKEDGDA